MKSNHVTHSFIEVCDHRPPIQSDFLEIEVHPASDDFRHFENLVNQGIDTHLEGFTLSQFGYRRYDSIGVRAFFNFHRSEVPILIRRLKGALDSDYDQLTLGWLADIENYPYE